MKVHFIAIGGSAMHNLAIALHQKGITVTGSDDEIFEPSRSRLSKYDLLPAQMGWNEEHITSDLDYVILGMHARKDNPELQRARDLNIKVVSYPEFLYEQSKDKTRVVIAGSHGKTSITAMVLHVLHFHDLSCDYMVGAQLEGFETMVSITEDNEFMLLEGDEYLSSPIDLRPKFLHYKPNISLISGIAWDHMNVFPTFDDYCKQFSLFVDSIEPGGVVIYNELDPEVVKVVEETSNEVKKFPYSIPEYSVRDGNNTLHTPDGDIDLSIFGRHNMNNLEGARWICNQMGVTDEQFFEAIPDFKGAARRLEIIYDNKKVKAYRDFAHAPSKVMATVNAVKENYGDRKVVALLELHTFSSLNIDFIKNYKGSMDAADVCIVYFDPSVLVHKKLPELSAEEVRKAFDNEQLLVVNDEHELLDNLSAQMGGEEAVFLIMSSGNFKGLDWKGYFEEREGSV